MKPAMEDTSPTSLAHQHPRHRYIGWLLWAALILLIIGLFAPMMTLKKFLFLKDEVSIYTGLIGLFDEGEYALFAIILIFSICFPLAKIFSLAYVWYVESPPERRKTLLHRIEALGRWSMLDVFVVALLVVTIKLGVFADVEVHAGIYFFAASVLAIKPNLKGFTPSCSSNFRPSFNAPRAYSCFSIQSSFNSERPMLSQSQFSKSANSSSGDNVGWDSPSPLT